MPPKRSRAHYLWAVLIAFIKHSADIRQIFDHIAMQSEPHAILGLTQLNFLSVPAVRQGAHIAIYSERLVRLLEVFLPMQ